MGTTDVLRSSIRHTHEQLAQRLETAEAMEAPPDDPHHHRQIIDTFVAETSKHVHAVDAVLLPPARKEVPDGGALVHDYLRSVKDLEIVLAHVKGHEYGSTYETSFSWPGVWSDVREAVADQQRHEQLLCQRLTDTLDDDELVELAGRLRNAERTAPTRPHPYQPHTGVLGKVSRRVMHAADHAWDTFENRIVPEPPAKPKKPPGLLAQYLLADPRFDESDDFDEPLDEAVAGDEEQTGR